MEKITYKKFIELSKYVTNFNKMSFKSRIIFYLEAPIRYKSFKKAYNEEIKSKTIKKEVK